MVYDGRVRLHFTVPADTRRGPAYMASAFTEWHGTLSPARPPTLVLGTRDGQLGFFLEATSPDGRASSILAQYPDGAFEPVATPPDHSDTWIAPITLRCDSLPLRSHEEFEDSLNRVYADPLGGLLRTLLPNRALRFEIRLTLTPASRRRVRRVVRALARGQWLRPPGFTSRLATLVCGRTLSESHAPLARTKLAGPLFEVAIQLVAHGSRGHEAFVRQPFAQVVGALNVLTLGHPARFQLGRVRRGRVNPRVSLLSPADVALLWHPPTANTAAERLSVRPFREREAPTDLPPAGGDGRQTCVLATLYAARSRVPHVDHLQ